jgi:hypothetical protein
LNSEKNLKLTAMFLMSIMLLSLAFATVSGWTIQGTWNGECPVVNKNQKFTYNSLTLTDSVMGFYEGESMACKVCEYDNVSGTDYAVITLRVDVQAALYPYLRSGSNQGNYWTGLEFIVNSSENPDLSSFSIAANELGAVNLTLANNPTTPPDVDSAVIYTALGALVSTFVPGAALLITAAKIAQLLRTPSVSSSSANPIDLTFTPRTLFDNSNPPAPDQVTTAFNAWATISWFIKDHDPRLPVSVSLWAITYCEWAVFPVPGLFAKAYEYTKITLTLSPDSHAPVVTHTPGSIGYATNHGVNRFITWNITDCSPTTYGITCDKTVPNLPNSGSMFTYTYLVTQDVSGLPEGNYVYTCTATDAYGHVTTDSVNVYVDSTPPILSLVEPAGGDKINGTPSRRGSGTAYVTVYGTASDDQSGIASINVLLDGNPYGGATYDQVSKTYSTMLNIQTTSQWIYHTIQVIVTNRAGLSESASVTISAITGSGPQKI